MKDLFCFIDRNNITVSFKTVQGMAGKPPFVLATAEDNMFPTRFDEVRFTLPMAFDNENTKDVIRYISDSVDSVIKQKLNGYD